MLSNRKPIPASMCNYQCLNCSHEIAAMPHAMETRQFCAACGDSMWKFKGLRKGGESNGGGSDKNIDSTFHRPMTKVKP